MASQIGEKEVFSLIGGAAGQTRLLHIYYDDWMMRKARVIDSDKATQLYRIEAKTCKPQMRIYHAASSPSSRPSSSSSADTQQFAEVVFPYWTCTRIDVVLDGQTMALSLNSMWRSARSFTSAVTGQRMTWKRYGGMMANPLNLYLADEQGNTVARFLPVNWAKRKAGKLELQGAAAENGPLMDEAVVTGFAVAQYAALSIRGSTAGTASAAGVAAAVAS
ncbi:hypothetical protein DV736_g2880, partial [Chaetothyriales sp. CBS 134916]